MFGKIVSILTVVLIVCCPGICGSGPDAHCDDEPGSRDHAPHTPSCKVLPCFCSAASTPSRGPSLEAPQPRVFTCAISDVPRSAEAAPSVPPPATCAALLPALVQNLPLLI